MSALHGQKECFVVIPLGELFNFRTDMRAEIQTLYRNLHEFTHIEVHAPFGQLLGLIKQPATCAVVVELRLIPFWA